MKLQLLYFSGCPSWENAFANLQDAVVREGLTASIELVEVLDDSDATGRKFLGSPSILVDGRDLWPETRNAYYMSCRMYRTPDGIQGWPTEEMIRQKLRALAAGTP